MNKRQQYKVLMVEGQNVQIENHEYIFHVKESDYLSISENAVFRKPEFHMTKEETFIEEVVYEDGKKEDVEYKKLVNYAFFAVYKVAPNGVSQKKQKMLVDRAKKVLRDGIIIVFPDGQRIRFRRVMRSASQYRSAKFLMTHDDLVKVVREKVSYGWINTFTNKKDVNVAKIEPYLSLASTSSLSAGYGWTSIDIEDAECWVDIQDAIAVQDDEPVSYAEFLMKKKANELGKSWKMIDGRVHAKMELTDGQGMISPVGAARASFRIGQITARQYKLVLKAFAKGVSFADQLEHPALGRIWAKISRGIQFRYGLKKGFLAIADHDYIDSVTGKQYDMVFPSGAIKGQVRAGGDTYSKWEKKHVELNIANVASTEDKSWGKLNYQFIQSLNIQWTDLRDLAKKGMQKVVEGLESPEKAIQFLGMIASGEEDEVEQSFQTKLHEMLIANPRAFYLRWVQKQLKKLMTVAIEDMKLGRIPLADGKFVFIVTDPNALMKNGKPLLKKGECYFNGETGLRAIFRSPLIHKSEPKKINLVNRPELEEAFGHLKNILVLNCYDDTLPRLGGADTDGDKVFMTAEECIVNAIEDLPMIYGDTKPKNGPLKLKWGKDGHEAIYQYDSLTLTPSQIGTVTNYCTAIVDAARDRRCSEENAKEYWNIVVVGRDVQGKIIDSAKTGQLVDIPEALKQKRYPHWLTGMTIEQYNNPKNQWEWEKAEKTYISESPMGMLFNYVMHVAMPALERKFTDADKPTIKVLKGVKYNLEQVENLIPAIEVLDRHYRLEMSDYFENNPEGDGYGLSGEALKEWKDKRNKQISAIIEKHKSLLDSLNYPTLSVAVACLHVAELAEDRSHTKAASYPYVIADEYMKALLAHAEGNYKLVALRNVDEDIWTETVRVNEGKIYNCLNIPVAKADVSDGEYETFVSGRSYYIKVPVESVAVSEEVNEVAERKVQFTLKGWHFYDKQASAQSVMELINTREVTTESFVGKSAKYGEKELVALVIDGKRVATLGEESDIVAFNIIQKQMTVVGVKEYKRIIMVDAVVTGEAVKPEDVTTKETHEEVPNVPYYTEQDASDQLDMFAEDMEWFGGC